MKKIMSLAVIAASFAVSASTVAIIDSGVDVKHEGLVENIWTNSNEIPGNNRDEDRNGYQDDIYGWNFAGQNNQVINYKYLGTFGNDVYKFFEIQARQFRGTISRGDIDWLKKMRQNQEFMISLAKFGNFVHGTHVAGIAAEGADLTKLLSVKLIPTEAKEQSIFKASSFGIFGKGKFKDNLIRAGLTALATAQADMLADIGWYLSTHNTDVANGSFGTGYPQAKMILTNLYRMIFKKRELPEEAIDKYAKFLVAEMVRAGANFVGASPNTLFVFAAGNDGLNNDEFGTSPANVKTDNTITVAATFGRSKIAPFSNYGFANVDVAAPGVIINSEVPGNNYLRVSGTSQAAPYVTNIAARVKDINPSLNPLAIKKILMGTVDKKDFLTTMVKSGGIVNDLRAVTAAQYSKLMPLADAISAAKTDIKDMAEDTDVPDMLGMSMMAPVLPLPSTIQ